MPVWRFRSFEAAERALWLDPRDARLAVQIRSVWARASRLARPRPARGVRRFRSLADAAHERDTWVDE